MSWLDLAGRQAAKGKARDLADRYALHLQAKASKEHAAEVERFNHIWTLLHANDSAIVMRVISAAFEDNEAPAAAVSVEGAEVDLVVLVPPDAVIPDRLPTTTSSGNLSLAKMNKSATAGWHRELVAGHVVVSAKEALAVAPGLQVARVVAVGTTVRRVRGTHRRAGPGDALDPVGTRSREVADRNRVGRRYPSIRGSAPRQLGSHDGGAENA